MMMILLVFTSLVSVGWAKGIPDNVGIQVFNGTDAYPGQFPYMAAIQSSGTFVCGGVLINPSWVVSDSNFIPFPEAVQVVLGLHDFDNFQNGGQPEVYDIEQIVREPGGVSFIALLKLSGPVAPGNPYIQTIALAPQDDYDYVGGNCYYCGWGQTESPGGSAGGVLQYSQANVVSEEECQTSVNNVTELCVADEYTVTCGRDDGGPLACRRDSQTYLVGTLKFSSDCYTSRSSLFHRISYYSDWIRTVID